jgi:hypothetical protein
MQDFLRNASQTTVPPGGLTFFIPINSAVDAMLATLSPPARAALATSEKGVQALVAYGTVLGGAVRTNAMQDGMVLNTIARGAQVRHVLPDSWAPAGVWGWEGLPAGVWQF